MKQQIRSSHALLCRGLLLALLFIMAYRPAAAAALTDVPDRVNDAAMQLVRHCSYPRASLNEQAAAILVDYVLSSKQSREHSLPKSDQCSGVYYEFDIRMAFPRFAEYSYNPLIPSSITRPASLRYSIWSNPRGDMSKMPGNWTAPPGGTPVVIRGVQHDSITPDPTTGAYYEYDLKRTLILLNHKGRPVLISVSKQADKSNVGKKGVILGSDNDWNYFYSNEPGTMKTGLGWAKSYIYDYFSVGVYTEANNSSGMVRAGVFQWLRAGWAGINFVKPDHILAGMKRFAQNSRMVLESPRLPAPGQLISAYQSLSGMPTEDLTRKYAVLQRALRSSALRSGKLDNLGSDEKQSHTDASREQMCEELMLEHLKMTLGKPTVSGN